MNTLPYNKGVFRLSAAGKCIASCAAAIILLQATATATTNARNFGAAGNGSNDDTGAIQSAINSAPGGDTIPIPAGTYRVRALTMASNKTLKGENGTVLKGQGGDFILYLPSDSASNITIDGITFDGGGINLNGLSVPASNINITNCTIQNILSGSWATQNGIFAPGGMSGGSISGNRFSNILEGGQLDFVDRNANALQLYRINGVSFTDNVFDTVNQAMSIQFDKGSGYNNIVISRNTGKNIHRMGIEMQGIGTNNLLVSDNVFTDFLKPYWNTFGLSIVVDGGSGTTVKNNTVDANVPAGSGSRYGYGIEIGGNQTTVTGNQVRGNWWAGIALGNAPNVVVNGNTLCGLGSGSAISWEADAKANPQIGSNNTLGGCAPLQASNPPAGDSGSVGDSAPTAPPPSAPPAQPPTASLSIVLPFANSTVAGTTLVAANVTSSAGVASLTLLLDDNQTVGTVTGPPYTFHWKTASLQNGEHTLKLVLKDKNNATYTSDLTTVNTSNSNSAAFATNGLKLWLASDSGVSASSGRVTKWTDQSGSGISATQASASNQPTLAAVADGRNVVRFDGTSNYLQFPLPINGLTSMTMILVGTNNTSQNGGWSKSEKAALFWDETEWWGTTYLTPYQANVAFRFGTTQTNNWPVYTRPENIGPGTTVSVATKNGGTDTLHVNGTLVLAESGKMDAIKGTQNLGYLGRGYNNTYFDGDLDEVLVYDRALTDAERQDVESYFKTKYGI